MDAVETAVILEAGYCAPFTVTYSVPSEVLTCVTVPLTVALLLSVSVTLWPK